MGTICEIEVGPGAGGPPAVERAFAEGTRIEALLSTWRDDSELSMLNRRGHAVVSEPLYALLTTAMTWCRQTNGTFNPLVRPLIDAWRTRAEGDVPASATLQAALRRVRPDNVRFQPGNLIVLSDGAAFEEGGFGKGYAIGKMIEMLGTAPALINFGGQLAVRGSRQVTIADPEHRSHPALALTIADGSLSTSSGSEKFFHVKGKRFSHLIDPRSGEALPPDGSVSVLHADPLTADILSTALYVMGPQAGLQWADENGVAALFITGEGAVRLSARFRAAAPDVASLDHRFRIEE
jgi:thiamine biosynthesis lipoprotein